MCVGSYCFVFILVEDGLECCGARVCLASGRGVDWRFVGPSGFPGRAGSSWGLSSPPFPLEEFDLYSFFDYLFVIYFLVWYWGWYLGLTHARQTLTIESYPPALFILRQGLTKLPWFALNSRHSPGRLCAGDSSASGMTGLAP